MPFESKKIELPGTDVWDTLFARGKKPFGDDLSEYQFHLVYDSVPGIILPFEIN